MKNPQAKARLAAKRLLATQSCTEDNLTAAIFEFAQKAIEDFGADLIDALVDDVNTIEATICKECMDKIAAHESATSKLGM